MRCRTKRNGIFSQGEAGNVGCRFQPPGSGLKVSPLSRSQGYKAGAEQDEG